jgi:hypothetical protein
LTFGVTVDFQRIDAADQIGAVADRRIEPVDQLCDCRRVRLSFAEHKM